MRAVQTSVAEIVGSGLFTDGDWVESKDQDPNGDVRLLQLADVGIGIFLDKSARFLTSCKAKQLKCTYLLPGDLMIARMPDPIGRACIFPGAAQPCVTVVDVCILRPDKRRVDSRWLLHTLNSPQFRFQVEQFTTGTTRKRISRGNLAKLVLNLPPLAEQRRIAAILDKADAIRRKRREAIALTEELLRSTFLDMFGDPVTNPKGWPQTTMSQLLQSIDSGWSPTCESHPPQGDGWGVLKLGAVSWGRYEPREAKALPDGVEPRPEKQVRNGQLLFVRKNTYELVGAAALVFETPERLMIPDLVFSLVPRAGATDLKPYIWQLFNHPGFRERSIRALAGGTSGSMPNIAKSKLMQLEIPFPDPATRTRWSKFVDRIETLHNQAKETHSVASNLFHSLVQRAFRGDL